MTFDETFWEAIRNWPTVSLARIYRLIGAELRRRAQIGEETARTGILANADEER